MPRAVKPWVGKTDNSKPSPKVRQRIFDKENGVCHVCKLPILATDKWDLDHVIALINGGDNAEHNLKPTHWHCHKDKTKRDVAEKSKVAKVRQKHLGIKAEKQKIPSRPKAPSTKEKSTDVFAGLPRRSLFRKKEI